MIKFVKNLIPCPIDDHQTSGILEKAKELGDKVAKKAKHHKSSYYNKDGSLKKATRLK